MYTAYDYYSIPMLLGDNVELIDEYVWVGWEYPLPLLPHTALPFYLLD